MNNKAKEASLRNKLSRRGYGLHKFKDGYGVSGYYIFDSYNVIICGSEQFPLSLDEVSDFVSEEETE